MAQQSECKPEDTHCFVEGFKFKVKLEALENNIDVFRRLDPSNPLQASAMKELEQIMQKQVVELQLADGCVSEELRSNITWHMTRVSEGLSEKDWNKLDQNLTYLETAMEGW